MARRSEAVTKEAISPEVATAAAVGRVLGDCSGASRAVNNRAGRLHRFTIFKLQLTQLLKRRIETAARHARRSAISTPHSARRSAVRASLVAASTVVMGLYIRLDIDTISIYIALNGLFQCRNFRHIQRVYISK